MREFIALDDPDWLLFKKNIDHPDLNMEDTAVYGFILLGQNPADVKLIQERFKCKAKIVVKSLDKLKKLGFI